MSTYNIAITSFDADYYYGDFYRQDDEGLRHHISHFLLDLDDDNAHSASLYFSKESISQQVIVDFEIEERASASEEALLLANKLENIIQEKRREIFQVVKKHGAYATFEVLDDGMSK